ncbi:MAG: cysteine-rich CWC family protein [Rhizobacter sp.]|nr:cysteine-rich CWC family protein [Rhizobacter sp.]
MADPQAPDAADRCPVCGEANGCAIAAAAAGPCWCVDASFSASVCARAALAGGASRCICARCAAIDDPATMTTPAR